MLSPTTNVNPAIFHFVMIKPSHYDDDGYPIQWMRSAIPSNTLACLNALALDASRRAVLEGGALRLKYRRDRRHGMPLENPLVFYARYWGGTALKLGKYARVYLRCKAMLNRALKAPDRWSYSDLAIAPPQADEFDALDLYHATAGGKAALKRKYRDDAIRSHAHVHAETAPPMAAE